MNHHRIQAAEILACYHPDPEKRRQRRREKLASLPEADQPIVRQIVERRFRERRGEA